MPILSSTLTESLVHKPVTCICNGVKIGILPALIAFCLQLSVAGQTTVRGRVTDATTFEPVVFANIVFKGTASGVKSGFDGSFILQSATDADSITVSFIGYETSTLAVARGKEQELDIYLKPALYSLGEVKVTPGENPALKILRKLRQHRESTGYRNLDSWKYDKYSRTTVYIRRFGDDGSREGGIYADEFSKYGIRTGEEGIAALPAYINEALSTGYYIRSLGREFIHITATNTKGLAFNNTTMVTQLTAKQENIDLSENNVLIADVSFVSPVSPSGPVFYKYYIKDTVVLNGHSCFEIDVVPRRPEDPVFTGTIWVADTAFALKRISVEVPRRAEINFIRRIKIQQDFEPYAGAWFPVMTRILTDAANIFATNYSEKSNILTGVELDPGFFSSEMKIEDNVVADESFWSARRPIAPDPSDRLAFQRIDSLKSSGKMRISAKLVEASVRGYYDAGKFDIGPWIMFYNHNQVEGSRFRLGGRTNSAFSERLFAEGYLAYGTGDRNIKGSLQTELFISRERWARLGLQYRDDLERVGSVDEFINANTFLSFASTFGGSDKMFRAQVARAWFETDIIKGVSGKVFITRKSFDPVSSNFVFAWYTDEERTRHTPFYINAELGVAFRYQPKAVYIVDGMKRFPVNFNKYPAFSATWSHGLKDFLDSDFKYDRLSAGIEGNYSLGGAGRISHELTMTKVFGHLPYPLLVNPAGNESVFRTSRTYNLMNYGEFVADEAVELFASYHMNGLLTDRLPLIKRLDLRTVISFHAIAGSFDESRNGFYDPETNPGGILPKDVNGFPLTGFTPLSKGKPYAELAYGVENILKFIRVDLVQRLTWLGNPDARRLAVKVSGVFRF